MIGPLIGVLVHDSGFFQKVLLDLGTFNRSGLVEEDVDVFAEAGRVVVTNGFGVVSTTYFSSLTTNSDSVMSTIFVLMVP